MFYAPGLSYRTISKFSLAFMFNGKLFLSSVVRILGLSTIVSSFSTGKKRSSSVVNIETGLSIVALPEEVLDRVEFPDDVLKYLKNISINIYGIITKK